MVIKTNQISIKASIGLMFVGLLFIAIGLFMYKTAKNFSDNAVPTEATIVSISVIKKDDGNDHRVDVEYYVDNMKYTNKLNYYDSSMRVGQIVTIKYLPDNPKKIIYCDSGDKIVFLMVISGFGLIGLGILNMLFRKKLEKKQQLIAE